MDRGTHLHNCDFQVHTPRDRNWKGKRPSTEGERREFGRQLIAACRTKGLHAIAVTDHHDFALFPFIKAAAASETRADGSPLEDGERITVFPGVELTLGVPCQALLILDAAFPEDRLGDVLKALNADVVDPNEATLGDVKPLENIRDLKDLHHLLDQRSWLKGRYIILPNVTDAGHKSLLRKAFAPKYKEMLCVGGYVDGSLDKLGDGNKSIVAGTDISWGSKRIAVFQTSDSRSEDFSDLGKHSTWVKWSAPTAEALRQACLAEESRIAQSLPELPSIYISRLSVDNSKFLGPIELEFNPQYNAVIGGRGTGKSTLLGYLRWALCDEPAAVQADEEVADPAGRQRRLIATTLAPTDSTVEVHFTINEIPHVVRRAAATGEITLKVGNEDFVKARESEIRELLPIHAYSQKQLSSVAVRLEELTRFVTAPIRRSLAEIDQRIDESTGKVRENYATLQRQRQVQATLRRLEFTEQSLKEQATNLRASLEDVSDDDRAVLDGKPAFDTAQAQVEAWNGALNRALDATARVHASLETMRPDQALPDGLPREQAAALGALMSTAEGLLTALETTIGLGVEDLRQALADGSDYSGQVEIVNDLLAEFEEKYAGVKERSTAHSAKLTELADIEKQQRATAQSGREQRTALQQLGRPDAEHKRLLKALFALMDERSGLLAAQCEALSEQSSGLIRATLKRGQGLAAAAERFRGVVPGSGLRSKSIDSFFESLAEESNPLLTWQDALNEMETLTEAEPEAPITSETHPVLARLGFPSADIKRISSKITPEGWLDLALTPVADHPVFEYQIKENEFIDFSLASAGQQATALLRVLFAQSGPPLMIDQPEDDLDSEVISDVVQEIWNAKKHRQLIFTSHNANLVVNGDAELVVYCDYRVRGEQSRGEIKMQGAIDLGDVRKAITLVMEGGEKAFRLRKEKYGF